MITTYPVTIVKANSQQRQAISQLLKEEKLPADDLPASLNHFLVALDSDEVIAAIGLELYGDCGLLRSMVISKEHRNRNIATNLVNDLENLAKSKGVACIYLLTETASGYFAKKGYTQVQRQEVPEQIKRSSEFSHVCPVSATVMKKEIK